MYLSTQQRPGYENDKWKHDLFDPLSSLYDVRLNSNNPMVRQRIHREESSSSSSSTIVLSQSAPPRPTPTLRQEDIIMDLPMLTDPPKHDRVSEQRETSLFNRFSSSFSSEDYPSTALISFSPSSSLTKPRSSLATRMGLNIKSHDDSNPSDSPPKQPKKHRLKEKKVAEDSRQSNVHPIAPVSTLETPTTNTLPPSILVVVENLVQGTTAEDVTVRTSTSTFFRGNLYNNNYKNGILNANNFVNFVLLIL